MELYLKAQSTSRELSCELFCGVVNLFTVDSKIRFSDIVVDYFSDIVEL